MNPWILKIWKFVSQNVSHKYWELPNSQIWLAEMDIDHDLEFPI